MPWAFRPAATQAEHAAAGPGPILIGAQRDDGRLFFKGDVGEVRIYRRALNAAEVTAISKLDEDSSISSCIQPTSK